MHTNTHTHSYTHIPVIKEPHSVNNSQRGFQTCRFWVLLCILNTLKDYISCSLAGARQDIY